MGLFKNLFTGYSNLLMGNEPPQEKHRREVCNTCSFRKKEKTNNWCTQCPCYMPAKVKSPGAKCPKKKWRQ